MRGAPAEVRFWKHVQRGAPDVCWLWQAGKVDGYGVFTSDERIASSGRKRLVKAHRFSWELASGPLVAGEWVLHTCDVRACVNPGHLFLGDHDDNMADQCTKGRHPRFRGTTNPAAQLTEADVIAIRARRGVHSGQTVALDYGVHMQTIYDIWQGRTWSWLTEETA